MKRLLVLLLGAMVASCDATPTPPPASAKTDAAHEDLDLDPGTLEIDIGRNGVILDLTHDLAYQTPGPPDRYPESPATLDSMLRAAVWNYNYERAVVCMHGYLPKHSCGAPYLPAWIHESPDVVPSLETLRLREMELSTRVGEFWDAACEEAKPRLKHEDWFPKCSIE